ncbi:MAG: hypothetical protein WCI87_09095, partial [Euryarchaeota archaeon]
MQRLNGNTWTTVATKTALTTGTYSFSRTETTANAYKYRTIYTNNVNSVAFASEASTSATTSTSPIATVKVAKVAPAKISATITLASSNTNPAAKQSFTFSGTLKAGSTPISGKKIILCRMDPSGKYSEPSSTTTNANGAYSFAFSEPVSGTYHYGAAFQGDTSYAKAYASLTLGVGNLQQSVLTVYTAKLTFASNESFTVYGTLQDGVSGAPLAGQSITLQVVQLWSGQSV